jgi:hypothetical protein
VDIQVILSTGIGGSRHGFVAGWLGTLPNFIDNHWSIDLLTGHTNGYMSVTKDIELGASFLEFLKNKSFTLSPTADLFLAGQVHTTNLVKYHNEIDYNCVTVTRIDTSNADPVQIQWDFLVKTFLRKNRGKGNYDQNNVWNIDTVIDKEYITNQDRIEKFKSIIKQHSLQHNKENLGELKFINLDYDQLFQPGGSVYLCKQIGITTETLYHKYWDQMLQLTQSPDSLDVWGVQWNKSDFFN